jgi:putative ABC transport system ATP-binding protein
MDLLKARHAEGTTIVMVTHSAHDSSYATRIVRLLDGRILSESTAAPATATSSAAAGTLAC